MFMHKFLVLGLLASACAWSVSAQDLYKYVDKNGKVTYSDVKPKPGEKATKVNVDHKDNVVASHKRKVENDGEGKDTARDAKEDKKAAAAKRESAIEAAEKRVADAKKALERGSEMTAEDSTIRVGRNAKGAPSGANTVIPKPAYTERVAKLEADVKEAEENLQKVKSENAGK